LKLKLTVRCRYIEAAATATFGSSVEVMLSVWGEAPEEGVLFHCGDAWATVVSVDQRGGPFPFPFELAPQAESEVLRYEGAVARRGARLALREQLRRDKSARPSLDEGWQGQAAGAQVAEAEHGALG
jgi:hypothetical protein